MRSDEIGIDHNYHVWIEPPAVLQGIQTETAISGTLSIIRTGTTVTGYFNTTEIFSDDYSSDVVTFLSFSLQNNGTKDSASVTFDNFYVTADSLFLPPLSGLKDPSDLPTLATLEVFPNPFGERTRIEYSLSAAGRVRLAIFDVAGRRITTLDGGYRNPGVHSVYWNGETQRGAKAPTGIYFVKLAFQGKIVKHKIALLR
ncbi:MAG: T9SS type A sorting domain-containing protein [Candidatus Latescibacteria bacterium]|nr:T9SS type A sorting domain-containing protein [Candidatus Latescibacterota bacterium]NIO56288.1 T9SS type A sorting domain-containing protein [Candidatus Latescibacterota bacterium]